MIPCSMFYVILVLKPTPSFVIFFLFLFVLALFMFLFFDSGCAAFLVRSLAFSILF